MESKTDQFKERIYHKAFSALDEKERALMYGEPSSDDLVSENDLKTDLLEEA